MKHRNHVRKYKLDILNYIYFHTPRKRWLNETRAILLSNSAPHSPT